MLEVYLHYDVEGSFCFCYLFVKPHQNNRKKKMTLSQNSTFYHVDLNASNSSKNSTFYVSFIIL